MHTTPTSLPLAVRLDAFVEDIKALGRPLAKYSSEKLRHVGETYGFEVDLGFVLCDFVNYEDCVWRRMEELGDTSLPDIAGSLIGVFDSKSDSLVAVVTSFVPDSACGVYPDFVVFPFLHG